MSNEALADLLARVEAAAGPDRELDARLYVQLIARLQNPAIEQMIQERSVRLPGSNVWLDGAKDWAVPRFTASLDAALALCERLGLDGWHILYSAMVDWRAHTTGISLNRLPLCVIAAMLKALIAKAEIDEIEADRAAR